VELRYFADPVRVAAMNTEQLRKEFLIESLFTPNEIKLIYCDVDRAVVGSAVPGKSPLELSAASELRASYFAERREIGVLNIGAGGKVTVDDKVYPMQNTDCLYIGRGSRKITFASDDGATPAQFYIISYPAHTAYPTTLASKAQAAAVQLGTEPDCNRRTLYKYIHLEGIKSCQLVMGFTQLQSGSAWNTMPPHTHARRTEVYMYFNLAPTARVFHFMGQPQETRHLLVADKQVAISPSWSIHCGAGTSHYAFCWAMGGENQTFDDMDAAPIPTLR
jgi:4-deoxy-L-threo-5-hexosulose-uronate ketol-isomerase